MIFQEVTLSRLLFVLFRIILIFLLQNVKTGEEFEGRERRINQPLLMDDLKSFITMRMSSTHWLAQCNASVPILE